MSEGNWRNVAEPSCPTCGQSVNPSELIVSLETNIVVYNGKTEPVAPRIAEFLFILNRHYPRLLESDILADQLWGLMRPPGWVNSLTVYASQSRAIGRHMGFEIINKLGIGYRIELK